MFIIIVIVFNMLCVTCKYSANRIVNFTNGLYILICICFNSAHARCSLNSFLGNGKKREKTKQNKKKKETVVVYLQIKVLNCPILYCNKCFIAQMIEKKS